jgi:hypothetical protein
MASPWNQDGAGAVPCHGPVRHQSGRSAGRGGHVRKAVAGLLQAKVPLVVSFTARLAQPCRWPRRPAQRFPASDGPGACPRLLGVRDAGEQPAQLDCGGKLPALVESGADRYGLRFGDDEHAREHGKADHTRQAGSPRRVPRSGSDNRVSWNQNKPCSSRARSWIARYPVAARGAGGPSGRPCGGTMAEGMALPAACATWCSVRASAMCAGEVDRCACSRSHMSPAVPRGRAVPPRKRAKSSVVHRASRSAITPRRLAGAAPAGRRVKTVAAVAAQGAAFRVLLREQGLVKIALCCSQDTEMAKLKNAILNQGRPHPRAPVPLPNPGSGPAISIDWPLQDVHTAASK